MHLYSNAFFFIKKDVAELIKGRAAIATWKDLYDKIKTIIKSGEVKRPDEDSIPMLIGHSNKCGYYIYDDTVNVIELSDGAVLEHSKAVKSWDELNSFILRNFES